MCEPPAEAADAGEGEASLPMESSRHMTEGVEKQANTSSVQLKCVRWGRTTDWPRHWPHMNTWPLWVLAADVCVEWHAAISMILLGGVRELGLTMVICVCLSVLYSCVCV